MPMEPPLSATPSSVVPIFATPFGVLPLPAAEKLNPVVAGLFAARASTDTVGAAQTSKMLCYRSGDDLLDWTDEPLRKVTGEVLRGVRSVVAAVNDFTAVQLQSLAIQARGWFTIVRQDGCLPATSYPLTSWCAIYCVEAPQPSPERRDSGVLRLYESRLGTMFTDATNSVTRIPYTPGHYTWRPVPGQVAVFPASITHEIALIRAPGQLTLLTVRARFVAPGQQGLSRW
jgi:hypothetical protein